MLEIEASMMTPAKVLETSGHAERFADLMVKDLKTGECFRADHLLEGFIEKQCSDKSVSQEMKDELKKLEPLIEGTGIHGLTEYSAGTVQGSIFLLVLVQFGFRPWIPD